VTAKVIAEKYEHFLLANPTWKIESIKSTVLKDFFCDVSTSNCKAAKKIVMDKLLEGMVGEYTKVFDYQLELLRSNPCSTIAVCLDPRCFLGLLIKDLNINDDGAGWVFISDQQKVLNYEFTYGILNYVLYEN
jgi:hypothetical protein